MFDLSKCTFLIPVRFDFKERIENFDFVLKFLKSNFLTHIFLYEESVRPYFHFFSNDVTKYKFLYSTNEYFHRTRVINSMIKDSSTSIVINYDSDVFLDVESYQMACDMILNDDVDLVIPYDEFWNIDKTQTKKIISNTISTKDLNLRLCKKRRENSVGGCIFFKRESYIKGGMENENFKAWGAEDDERYLRFQKLGFVTRRLTGCNLYHLDHPRGINSKMHTLYYRENIKELRKVSEMSCEDLRNYIYKWAK